MGALDWNKIVHQHQGWRLISCIWLHAGLIHLVVNMLSLLFIGIRLEQQFGFGKLIIVPNHYNCNFYDMISNILTFCLKDCLKKIFSWYANVDLTALFLSNVSFLFCGYILYWHYFFLAASSHWCHIPTIRFWWQRAVCTLPTEQRHLCWCIWSFIWPAWIHALRATHELDYLFQQGQ